jgi:hypothetical protein
MWAQWTESSFIVQNLESSRSFTQCHANKAPMIASDMHSSRTGRQLLRCCHRMAALSASVPIGPVPSVTMMMAVGWSVGTLRLGLLGMEPSISRACSFCLVQPLPSLSRRPVFLLGWVSTHFEALRGYPSLRTARAKCSCSILRPAACVQPALEGTRFTRDLLPPLVSRLRVEGGAPYLWESGLPTYASDEHDTRLTYPNG